jgi:ubiquinone/menaquinone biosynthesis C-methylase UbiE
MLDKKKSVKLDKLLDSVGDMALKRRARRLIEELDIHESDRIIDLGCGDGFFIFLLKSLFPNLQIQGVDNDAWALERAKERVNDKKLKLQLVDLQNLSLKENYFDKAFMTEVLEHVPNDKKALTQIYKILKPNGMLILTVPSYNFPFFWDPINWVLQNIFDTHIKEGFWAGIWKQHIRLYKKDELDKLLTKVGFNVEHTEEVTSWCLPFNHFLVNIVARVLYTSNKVFSKDFYESLDKFKNVKRPWYIRLAFWSVNEYDKLNDIFPIGSGLNLLVKVRKPQPISSKQNR